MKPCGCVWGFSPKHERVITSTGPAEWPLTSTSTQPLTDMQMNCCSENVCRYSQAQGGLPL